jgi:hypothetical protein
MANNENPDDSPKRLKQDSLVEQLNPDLSGPPSVRALRGWLGKGTEEGAWRLYLTPQMDEYVQFSDKDVVHTEAIQQDRSPLGGTIVWLKIGTVLNHTRVVTRQVQADFLFGEITSGFMAGTAPSFPTAGLIQTPLRRHTNDWVCSTNPHIPMCQVHTERCGPGVPDTSLGCVSEPLNFVC